MTEGLPSRGQEVDCGGGVFTTTHWSVVLQAGDRASAEGQAALEILCKRYWYPLYAYVRRQGHPSHAAQDLTQAFFAQLLSTDFLQRVSPQRGRFRSFLLACLRHFLADEWDKNQAAKRGGGQVLLALDEPEAEGRYRLEPVDPHDPETFYERRWALTVLDNVLDRLQDEYASAGKGARFEQLQPFLLGEKGAPTYADVARQLGSTLGAVTMMVSRMRQRYRKLFREEIAHTVASHGEIEAEMQHLFGILGR